MKLTKEQRTLVNDMVKMKKDLIRVHNLIQKCWSFSEDVSTEKAIRQLSFNEMSSNLKLFNDTINKIYNFVNHHVPHGG